MSKPKKSKPSSTPRAVADACREVGQVREVTFRVMFSAREGERLDQTERAIGNLIGASSCVQHCEVTSSKPFTGSLSGPTPTTHEDRAVLALHAILNSPNRPDELHVTELRDSAQFVLSVEPVTLEAQDALHVAEALMKVLR